MKTKNENSMLSKDRLPVDKLRRKSGNPTWLPSDYSPPTLKVDGVNDQNLTISCDFNLTVRIKVKEFNRKQATMLIGQSLYKVAKSGLTIVDWLILEFLYNYLNGSKQTYEEMTDFREFELLLILKTVLTSVRLSDPKEIIWIPDDLSDLILSSKFVPKLRTFYSREASYRLDKFLSIRSVPVESLLDRSENSERYSGYCKGYGESSPTGHRRKTRPSAELDGEPVSLDFLKFQNFKLFYLQELFQLTMLEAKYRYLRFKL